MPTDLQSGPTLNPETQTPATPAGTSRATAPRTLDVPPSAARLIGYVKTDLTVSYEPGVTCPRCGEQLWWHDLKPFGQPLWMECEPCELLTNIETEEVWRRA